MQDPVFMAKSEIKDVTDDCGKVISINKQATLVMPFYYLPLLIMMLLFAKKLIAKILRSAVTKPIYVHIFKTLNS